MGLEKNQFMYLNELCDYQVFILNLIKNENPIYFLLAKNRQEVTQFFEKIYFVANSFFKSLKQ